MTWSSKRQISYILVLIVFFSVLGLMIAYPYLNAVPTCFDNKQNGNETGIDCGGSCSIACISQVDPISILWSRTFKVVEGRYNAVAYLENHNANVAVYKIKYKFRFADKDNIYIGKREGEAFIPSSAKFAIFEPAIDVGNSIPVYTTFEFTEKPIWVQIPVEKINQLKILISDINLQNTTTSPILSATIKNNSLFIIPDVNVIVILYDKMGNAISSSKTYIDKLLGEESKDINFTWPEPFSGEVITKEIIPMFNVFSVKLQ